MASIRIPGAIAGLVGLVVLGIYVAIIVSEGDDAIAEIAPWAVAIAGASVAALFGSLVATGSAAMTLLRVAAGVFFVVGVLGLFSIGLPLIVAAVLCLVTSERQPAAVRPRG